MCSSRARKSSPSGRTWTSARRPDRRARQDRHARLHDTHHHQFETALRSFLADGPLFNDGQPHGAINYFQYILGTFAPVYRPEDVYISELFGSLSQLDAEAINVHPLNVVLGAVVSLMERFNAETVIVAGKIPKWKGKLLDAAGGCGRPHD